MNPYLSRVIENVREKYANEPSWRTAMKNGMRFVEEYADPVNEFTRVYRITREEWNALEK